MTPAATGATRFDRLVTPHYTPASRFDHLASTHGDYLSQKRKIALPALIPFCSSPVLSLKAGIMQNWEYKIIRSTVVDRLKWKWEDNGKTTKEQSVESRLAEMGRQGWELVNISTYQSNGFTALYDFYFKRLVLENAA